MERLVNPYYRPEPTRNYRRLAEDQAQPAKPLIAITLTIMYRETAKRATLGLTATTAMKKLKFHKTRPPMVTASDLMQHP